MAHARELANRTGCASNLRQIGIAVATYSTDHAELIPPHFGASGINEPLHGYLQGVKPIVSKHWNGCPSKGGTTTDPLNSRYSYGINSSFYPTLFPYYPTGVTGNTIQVNAAQVKKPSQCALGWDNYWFYATSQTHYERNTLAQGRHDGEGLNFLFVDGHTVFFRGGAPNAGNLYPEADWLRMYREGWGHTSPQNLTSGIFPCNFGGCIWHPF